MYNNYCTTKCTRQHLHEQLSSRAKLHPSPAATTIFAAFPSKVTNTRNPERKTILKNPANLYRHGFPEQKAQAFQADFGHRKAATTENRQKNPVRSHEK